MFLRKASYSLKGYNLSIILNDVTNSVTINGEEAEIKELPNGKKYIVIGNISSNKLGELHTVKTEDAEFKVSAYSYVYIVLNNESKFDASLVTCCKALCDYGLKAETLFGKE